MKLNLDRLIVGSNPLTGGSHYLSERARLRQLDAAPDRPFRVLEAALSSGATGFTFNCDSASFELIRQLSSKWLGGTVGLYPLVPNSALVPVLLQSGTAAAVREVLRDVSFGRKTRALISGGWSWLTTSPLSAANTYLDVELGRVTQAAGGRLELKAVFLHELLTDALVGLDLPKIVESYVGHLGRTRVAVPGFVTRNLPGFVALLERAGVDLSQVIVMTPFNKLGFQMTPTRLLCEQTLESHPELQVIGMSFLGGGQIALGDAIQYLRERPLVRSLAIGVSSSGQAEQTFGQMAAHIGSLSSR